MSASELAQMGRCEQLVAFEHRHGRRRLPHQHAARRRGLVAHARFAQAGLKVRAAGPALAARCFVVGLLFGEGWQIQVLGRFRDTVLRERPWGHVLIRLYGHVGPKLCVLLQAWPCLQRPVRWGVGLLAAGLLRRWG